LAAATTLDRNGTFAATVPTGAAAAGASAAAVSPREAQEGPNRVDAAALELELDVVAGEDEDALEDVEVFELGLELLHALTVAVRARPAVAIARVRRSITAEPFREGDEPRSAYLTLTDG
jgi:hypothetical protein